MPEYVTAEAPKSYSIADDLQLDVYANPTAPRCPAIYEGVYDPAGGRRSLPLLAVSPPGGAFDSEAERIRLAAQVARVYPGETHTETYTDNQIAHLYLKRNYVLFEYNAVEFDQPCTFITFQADMSSCARATSRTCTVGESLCPKTPPTRSRIVIRH